MGFLKMVLNANNAEGIREAMRLAYRRHRRNNPRHTDDPPHLVGLFGAMGTRMLANGLPAAELSVWLEVAPFAIIEDEEVSVEALAEYAVYVERTVDAKVEGLRAAINGAFRRGEGEPSMRRIMTAPQARQRRWYALLDDDVRSSLETAAHNV